MEYTIFNKVLTFSIDVMQDDTEVRGNAMASGDDALDKEVEDEIIRRLDSGDPWAWAVVTVNCEWTSPVTKITYKGFTTLCGCNYKDEKDFIKAGDYYEQMKQEAFEDMLTNMHDRYEHGEKALSDMQTLGLIDRDGFVFKKTK